eukprot:scaffold42856_cov87-Phaeocystis_antarctica.AAC.2
MASRHSSIAGVAPSLPSATCASNTLRSFDKGARSHACFRWVISSRASTSASASSTPPSARRQWERSSRASASAVECTRSNSAPAMQASAPAFCVCLASAWIWLPSPVSLDPKLALSPCCERQPAYALSTRAAKVEVSRSLERRTEASASTSTASASLVGTVPHRTSLPSVGVSMETHAAAASVSPRTTLALSTAAWSGPCRSMLAATSARNSGSHRACALYAASTESLPMSHRALVWRACDESWAGDTPRHLHAFRSWSAISCASQRSFAPRSGTLSATQSTAPVVVAVGVLRDVARPARHHYKAHQGRPHAVFGVVALHVVCVLTFIDGEVDPFPSKARHSLDPPRRRRLVDSLGLRPHGSRSPRCDVGDGHPSIAVSSLEPTLRLGLGAFEPVQAGRRAQGFRWQHSELSDVLVVERIMRAALDESAQRAITQRVTGTS